MGRGVDVGIHADGDRSHEAHLAGHLVDALELLLRLDIEAVDPLAQGEVDIPRRLADTCKGAPVGAPPRLEDPEEFAARDDVESRTFLCEQVQHGKVAVRLHGVADHPVAERRERRIESAEIVPDRLGRIDVGGSPHLGSHGIEIHTLALERAIDIAERMHRERLKA